jgi:hypothetical protein
MNTPSIKTPELQVAIGPLTNLLKAADQGVADPEQGKLIIGASNSLCRAVKTDVDARIARTKAVALEAKIIEGAASDQKQIAA